MQLTPALKTKIAALEAQLLRGDVPQEFRRFPGEDRFGVVKLGWAYRAVVDLREHPWRIDRVITHETYNVWRRQLRRR
jgi:hypothetical protein